MAQWQPGSPLPPVSCSHPTSGPSVTAPVATAVRAPGHQHASPALPQVPIPPPGLHPQPLRDKQRDTSKLKVVSWAQAVAFPGAGAVILTPPQILLVWPRTAAPPPCPLSCLLCLPHPGPKCPPTPTQRRRPLAPHSAAGSQPQPLAALAPSTPSRKAAPRLAAPCCFPLRSGPSGLSSSCARGRQGVRQRSRPVPGSARNSQLKP